MWENNFLSKYWFQGLHRAQKNVAFHLFTCDVGPVEHSKIELQTWQEIPFSSISWGTPISPLQHVVFFVLRAIDWIVPDVPESLELKIKRERYLAKRALAENQEALLVSQGRGATPATPGTSSPGQCNMGYEHTHNAVPHKLIKPGTLVL